MIRDTGHRLEGVFGGWDKLVANLPNLVVTSYPSLVSNSLRASSKIFVRRCLIK